MPRFEEDPELPALDVQCRLLGLYLEERVSLYDGAGNRNPPSKRKHHLFITTLHRVHRDRLYTVCGSVEYSHTRAIDFLIKPAKPCKACRKLGARYMHDVYEAGEKFKQMFPNYAGSIT